MALTKTPIELSSTPGIVDNSNATAITIDSSENVALAGAISIVGGIGELSAPSANDLAIYGTASGHTGIRFHDVGILPTNNAGAITDNDCDIGIGTHRFKDLFLSGKANTGSITTDNANTQFNKISRTGAVALYVQQGDSTNDILQLRSGNGQAGTGTQQVTVTASGNLYVGGTSVGASESFTAEAHGSLTVSRTSGSGRYMISFDNGNTNVGRITSSASATQYNTSSDYRLKENVVPMTGSIDRVKALKPSRFNFIVDADKTVDGFLAHEAQAVVPECVTGTKDAMMDEEYEVTAAIEEVRDEDDNITTEAVEAVMGTRSVPDMQGIDQSKLVPLLTATIQELIARIEALENGE
jgi:hypothetical protein